MIERYTLSKMGQVWSEKRKLDITWVCMIRVDFTDEETLQEIASLSTLRR